ncbi:hypothetical protein KAR91_34565 [Candidatus Pacearchaeota archaeon]|nr:hypothetical protein [Candidatus Pacearchaeota archaeon]
MDRKIGEVEKEIPIPKVGSGRIGYSREYMSRADMMEIGDSFQVSTSKEDRRRVQACILGALRRQRSGKKFTTRILEDGVRVWRVE